MLHRWGKGKKDKSGSRLPTGEPIEFLTVGGRTSAYIRKLQRKVGHVADGVEKSGSSKRKRVKQENSEPDEALDEASEEDSTPAKEGSGGGRGRGKKRMEQTPRRQKGTVKAESKTQQNTPDTKAESEETAEILQDESAVLDDREPEVLGLRRSRRSKA